MLVRSFPKKCRKRLGRDVFDSFATQTHSPGSFIYITSVQTQTLESKMFFDDVQTAVSL